MAEIYFHCSNATHAMLDRRGAAVDDLTDARARAVAIVRSLIMTPTSEDWRDWVMHVSDEFGEEIFIFPFAFLLGKPN